MGGRCADNGCKASATKEKTLHFHYFPTEPIRREKWTRFVAVRRPSFMPTNSSKLCERHFTADQYEARTHLASSIGYKHRVRHILKKEAVPTVVLENGLPMSTERIEVENMDDGIEFIATPLMPISSVSTSSCTLTTATTTTTTTTASMSLSTTVTAMPQAAIVTPKSTLNWFADTCIEAETSRIGNVKYSVQTQTPYNLIQRKSTAIQNSPVMKDQGTQTTSTLTLPPYKPEFDCSFISSVENTSRDTEWTLTSEDEDDEEEIQNEPVEQKFIVNKSNLEELLKDCGICGMVCNIQNRIIGTCVIYTIQCVHCGMCKEWTSQPFSGTMPFGNLVLSAALLFAGASPLQTLRLLEFAGIASISVSTYMAIQTAYLSPAIRSLWQQKQLDLMQERENRQVRLGGDGRCCSPGHTAKFCSYTMMDLETGHILDIQLIQSNEVANSYGMEKEGLIRSLNFLTQHNIHISHLVTDRHSAVKKYMRENWPNIQHWFDVWHMAKGVHKKLVNAGKKKHCEKTGNWARSVSNHMYWCAASSNGDGDLVKEKWLSILNHVVNIHDGHGERFPSCAHDEIDVEKDWMIKDRKPYEELEKVVTSKVLLTDIQKLSPAEQTSSLEAFHKVVCSFAPKAVHFFHPQMEARLYLAGMHFNANQKRPQKHSRSGAAQYRVSFPKGRDGGIAKEVKTDMNFDYVTDLMQEVLLTREVNESYRKANRARRLEEPSRPGPLCQSTPRANKRTIVESHIRRFNR